MFRVHVSLRNHVSTTCNFTVLIEMGSKLLIFFTNANETYDWQIWSQFGRFGIFGNYLVANLIVHIRKHFGRF